MFWVLSSTVLVQTVPLQWLEPRPPSDKLIERQDKAVSKVTNCQNKFVNIYVDNGTEFFMVVRVSESMLLTS